MSEVTTITTEPPLTFVTTGTLIITTIVTIEFNSVGLSGVLGWEDKMPLPSVILMATVKGVASFNAVPQQQLPS